METRVSGYKADKVIKKTSFKYSFHVEARGFSGGLWVLWGDDIHIEILDVNHNGFDKKKWLITVV